MLVCVYLLRSLFVFCLFFFLFLASLHGIQDLSSLTRDRTHAPAVEAQSVNHWTAREVPSLHFLMR